MVNTVQIEELQQRMDVEYTEETIIETRPVRPTESASPFNSEAHPFGPPPAYGEFTSVGPFEPPPAYSEHASPQELFLGRGPEPLPSGPPPAYDAPGADLTARDYVRMFGRPPSYGEAVGDHGMSGIQKAFLAAGAAAAGGLAGAGALAYHHYANSHGNLDANEPQHHVYPHDAAHI
ncbi:hypothetical protein [Rhodoligotrophos defluvii]|uniref:hypothetical protein n=1 Tax=Rhodoligotrophos defluvii TaxID=2561934 RepID=UPI0010C98E82|nr:hypothetical protein [Rhodoligotrophos defluvii]